MPDEVASVTARAAKLLRANQELRQAKVHELCLPRIVQQFVEAIAAVWEQPAILFSLTLPGSMSAGGVPVEIPGKETGVHVTITAKRDGRDWTHRAAFGQHSSHKSVEDWVATYGNAYDAPQLRSEPAVFAAFRQFFHLENKQFLGLTIKSGGEPALAAAQAALLWSSLADAPDQRSAYEAAMKVRHPALQVEAARARAVAAQAKRLPRTIWPDVVPLSIIRNRADLNPLRAILYYLTDTVGMSLSEAGAAVGLSKSSVNTLLRRATGRDSQSMDNAEGSAGPEATKENTP